MSMESRFSHTTKAGLIAGAVVVVLLPSVDAAQRSILAPTLVMFAAILVFGGVVWDRQGHLPLLDIGVFFMVAAFCYGVLPFVQHLLCGMTYTIPGQGAAQCYVHPPAVEAMAALAWRYAVFIVCVAVAYPVIRGAGPGRLPLNGCSNVRWPTIVAVVITLAGVAIVFAALRHHGVDLNGRYPIELKALRRRFDSLPLPARQVIQNLDHVHLGLQIAVTVVLMHYRAYRWARIALFGWMAWLVLVQIGGLRARTPLVAVLLAMIVLWHTFVRPVRLRTLAAGGLMGLVLFTTIPVLRNAGSLPGGLHEVWRQWTQVEFRTRMERNTEFQNGLAGTYDLYRLKQAGLLIDVPWQIRAFDVLVLIPQQLLPFKKVDPQRWYRRELADTNGFFMLNPIGQAILGFDWIELVLRGAGLGVFFGLLHRWYARRPDSFWRVWGYLWLTIFAYYAIRTTTFILLYWIMYRVFPALLGVWVLSTGIQYVTRRWMPGFITIAARPVEAAMADGDQQASADNGAEKMGSCAASADR